MEKKDKNKKKSSIGYYSVVAFSLAVIGSVSWFAATKTEKAENNGAIDEYSGISDSYNKEDETEKNTTENESNQTETANKDVTDQPYETTADTSDGGKKSSFVMPVDGAILKPYSSVDLQYSATYNDMRLHEGIDIKCAENSLVKAAYEGTVTDIIDDTLYGKTVVIDHGKGITVRYCGLNEITVGKGAKVQTGEQIGLSGQVPCECADEPHIHIDAVSDNAAASVFDLLSIAR